MEREAKKVNDILVFESSKPLEAKYIKGGKDSFELEKVSEQNLIKNI